MYIVIILLLLLLMLLVFCACRFINNFGMLGVLDRLHGTDSLFRASRAYQRHILLLGFVPLSVQFPDDPKQQGKAGPVDLVDQKLE